MPKDPSESRYHLPQPPIEMIRNFSAYFRVTNGEYRIPTYFVHGIADSQIPWQQSQKTHNALVRQGIPTGIAVLAGERHLFDLESDPEGIKWKTYEAAYKFLLRFLHSLTHTGD
jgi:dipeptidyl aminopeptidase/acylaminoacyl peptidase